jgi:hypothetical protein
MEAFEFVGRIFHILHNGFDIHKFLVLSWMLSMFFHSLDFDEIDDLFENIAEKVDEGVVAHQTQVKIALEDSCFTVNTDATVVSQHVGHFKLLINFLGTPFDLGFVFGSYIFLDHADGSTDDALIGGVGMQIVRKVNRHAINGAEGIPLPSYFIGW